MISSIVTRTSAALLLAAGFALLFASDVLLPRVFPGFPLAAAWLGQLVAAGWLALATLNWSHRATILGGIYGRPAVFANLVLYTVSALVLIKAIQVPGSSSALWLMTVPFAVMAAAYGVLLFRGPFDVPANK